MVLLEDIIKDFENRLKSFEKSHSNEKKMHLIYSVFLFPIAFFYLFFLALISGLKKIFGAKINSNESLDDFLLESNQEIFIEDIKPFSVKRPTDYTSKYLYQTEFGDLDHKEKEAYFKEQLEISRKEYYQDLTVRELNAGGEGIGCNVFAEVTNIPPGQGSTLSAKMKERKEEKDNEPIDIEALREKLLSPKDAGGGAERSIKFEPVATEGGN